MCSLIIFLVYHNNYSLLTERDIMLYKLLKKLLIHDFGPSSLFGWSTPILWMKTKSHKTSFVVDVRHSVKRRIIMRIPASACCFFIKVNLISTLVQFLYDTLKSKDKRITQNTSNIIHKKLFLGQTNEYNLFVRFKLWFILTFPF